MFVVVLYLLSALLAIYFQFRKDNLEGVKLSQDRVRSEMGVVTCRQTSDLKSIADDFISVIAQHRHWMRFQKEIMPA